MKTIAYLSVTTNGSCMNEEALRQIRENKRTKEKFLDLSNYELEGELPQELFECVWLEGLNLSPSMFQKGQIVYSLNSLTNISFLQHLSNLQTLDLSFNSTSDFSFLQYLPNLQTLDLSGNNINDLRFLQHLPNLQTLDLSGNLIYEISLLQHLPNLQTLNLSGNFVDDFGLLQYLPNLQTLDLSSNHINKISFLQQLTSLKALYLSRNNITDISFLQPLTNLKTLNLSGNGINETSSLQKLTKLQTIDLSYNRITDINFLQLLTNLQTLDLNRNFIAYFNLNFLNYLPLLKTLDLSNNPLKNIPGQISNQSNCLTDLRNYSKDKEQESILAHESKLILVGNGRTGKTSVFNRLIHNTFDPLEPSTHAIKLEEWELPGLAGEQELEKIQLHVWDFGGQDIYHATHRYFLQTQALFILVWDVETEAMPEQFEVIEDGKQTKKVCYKNYSIPYWLSYIKIQGNNSPVVVVQTKKYAHGKIEPLTPEEKKQFNVVNILSVECSESKWSLNGFKLLQGEIETIVAKQIQHYCTEIPAQWYHIRNQIISLEKDGAKRIDVSRFMEMCHKEGLDKSSAHTLLKYLHNSGVFYYQQGLFNDQIVVDQQWAINAVYTLFDRKGLFLDLQHDGRFTGKHLQRTWQEFTIEEQELFVSFMQQCEICFEEKRDSPETNKTPFVDRKFVVPQLLPEEKPKEIQYVFTDNQGIFVKYRHQFLHAAVIQRFIVRVGFLAEVYNMWNKGVLLQINEQAALIEAFLDKNEIIVRIKDAHSLTLLNKIRNILKEINRDDKDIQVSGSPDGINFVLLDHLRNHPPENEKIRAENGQWVSATDYRLFLLRDEQVQFDKQTDIPMAPVTANSKPKIYFSYAWRDSTDEDREKFVDKLYYNLKQEDGYNVIRDKEELGYKGSISAFMKEIGRGDLVVVAISDKYLKSEYCMYELHELYLNSKSQLEELRKKIFPVRVESLALNKPKTQKIYMDYWSELKKEWEELVHSPAKNASIKQYEKLHKIVSIEHELGDFLEFIADMNTKSPELLSQNNFEEIKKAIKQQIDEIA